MTFLHSILLGIVEGVTEFLPISSTGHLILTSKLLSIPDSEFLKSFEIFIQLGAILAVVYYYRRTIFSNSGAWKKILVAFLPTAVIGLVLYRLIKDFLLGNAAVVVYSLIIGGIILIAFEVWQKKRTEKGIVARFTSIAEVPYRIALFLGIAQALAVIPGVSRSGTTIVAGQSMSLSRKAVIEFSFLLAIPTMLAATALDLLETAWMFSSEQVFLLFVGFAVSFVVALAVIKWLLSYVQNHTFIAFGVYRIVLGLLYLRIFL